MKELKFILDRHYVYISENVFYNNDKSYTIYLQYDNNKSQTTFYYSLTDDKFYLAQNKATKRQLKIIKDKILKLDKGF